VSFLNALTHHVDEGSLSSNVQITKSYEQKLLDMFSTETPTAKKPLSSPLSCRYTELRVLEVFRRPNSKATPPMKSRTESSMKF